MSRVLVKTENLAKRYKLYPRPASRLVEWITAGHVSRHRDFWALKDFNFEVRQGECIGIIGSNGAGKSTLLRILGKTLLPTSGSFCVDGRALSLLELGTGFNPELTGTQNVANTARLLGLPEGYAERRMADIENFADLGDFVQRPIKTYSTGMTLRLAFSMFAFFDPDVLIIDEALAVGDVAFQRKCFRRMQELVEDANRAVILVSHDLQSITRLCSRVYWIDHGSLRMTGDATSVVQEYLRHTFSKPAEDATGARETEEPSPQPSPWVPFDRLRAGTREGEKGAATFVLPQSGTLSRSPAAIVYPAHGVELLGLWVEDQSGNAVATVGVDQPFAICYGLRFIAPADRPIFGIRLGTTRGDCLIATNTRMMQLPSRPYSAGEQTIVRWPILPGLGVGDYFISCGCSLEDDPYRFLLRQVDGYQFSIVGPLRQSGLCSINGTPVIGKIA